MTTPDGYLDQELEYYPFGQTRVDNQYGNLTQTNQFTGHNFDAETNLTYMGARYYSGNNGKFGSQDPVSHSLGSPALLEATTNSTFDLYLKNPQAHNTYSYTANNPLKYKDRNGEWLDIVVDIGFTAYSAYKLGQAILTNGDVKGEATNLALDAGGMLIPGVVGAGTMRRASEDTYSVYQGVDENDVVRYVGITKRDPNIRFSEHQRSVGTGKENLIYKKIDGTGNLSKTQARTMEQSKIDQYGMQKNGGQLVNKRNSISSSSLKSTSSSLKAAYKAIGKGDYKSATKHLKKANASLSKAK